MAPRRPTPSAAVLGLLGLLVACRGEPAPPAPGEVAASVLAARFGPEFARLEPFSPAWQAQTRRLSRVACARVVAPHLYRIERDGRRAHLLGTRHIGVGLDRMPALVRTLVASAPTVVFETVDGGDDEGTLDQAPAAPWPEVVGAEARARFRELMGARAAQALEQEPAVVATASLSALFEDTDAGLDGELEALAGPERAVGLETDAFQEALLVRWLDARALRAALTLTDGGHAELLVDAITNLAAYCAGTDTDTGITDEDRADMRATGYTDDEITRFEREMLADRNRAWLPRLEAHFTTPEVFVAVGAGHLYGADGLLALLRARGFVVTRLGAAGPVSAGPATR